MLFRYEPYSSGRSTSYGSRRNIDDFQDRREADRGRESSVGGRGNSGRGVDPRHLTHSIKSCATLYDLEQILEESGRAFNSIHAAAALSQAQRLCQGRAQSGTRQRRVVGEVLRLLAQRLPEGGQPRELSSALWAIAKLGLGGCSAIVRDLAAMVGTVMPLRSFSSQDICNILWALATIGTRDPRLVDALLSEAERKLRDFNSQDLANTVWALAKLEHPGSNDFVRKLLLEAELKLRDFTPQHLTNTVWALATLEQHGIASFVIKLLLAAEGKLRDFTAQQLANTLWALAKLECPESKDFISKLLLAADHKLRDFKPQELSNTIWALAKLMHLESETFVNKLLAEAERKLHHFKPQELANTVWALATLGHSNASVFVGKLVLEAVHHLQDFKPQELANTMWALAKLAHPVTKASVDRLLDEAGRKLPDMLPQHLANVFWALATLQGRCDYGAFVNRLLAEAERKLRDFTSQELASVAWAMATLEHPHTASFVDQLIVEADRILESFDSQALANTLWALAKLEHSNTRAFHAFVDSLLAEAEHKLRDFTPQALANTVWAMATLRHHEGRFINSAAQQIISCKHKFNSREIGQLLSSLPSLGYVDPVLYGSLGPLLISRSDIYVQSVCNVFHGLAVAGIHPPWAMELLLEWLPAKIQEAEGAAAGSHLEQHRMAVDPRDLMQAFHFLLMLEARGSLDPQAQSSHAFQRMRELCRAAWMEGMSSTESRSHREVFAAVCQLPGCSGAVCERRTEDGLFSMDIGLEVPSAEGIVKLAIEVDGPFHFMSNKPTMVTGETLLRNALLEARGWRVVSVPVGMGTMWRQLGALERSAYLEGLIANAMSAHSGHSLSMISDD